MSSRLTRNKRLLITTTDQFAASGSNFLLVFLLARGLSPEELGIFFLAYAVFTLSVALARNAFGAILGMDIGRYNLQDSRVLLAHSLVGVLLISLLPTGSFLAMSTFMSKSSDISTALAVLSLSFPFAMWQDLLRMETIADGRPQLALTSDLLWLTICTATFVASLSGAISQSAVLGAFAWSTGAVLSAILLTILAKPPWPRITGFISWIKSDIRRYHLSLDAILGSAAPLINASLAGVIATTSVVAAVKGAGTLFGPLNILMTAAIISLVPEVKRNNGNGAKGLFRWALIGLIAISLLWGISLSVLPESAGIVVLGSSWALVQPLLLLTTLEYCGLALWTTAIAKMRSNNATGLALKFRLAHASITALLPALALYIWGSAVAFASALALISLILGALGLGVVKKEASE